MLSLVFAIISAWLIGNFNFPLRRQFTWLLFLPLAMVSYVVAYLYTDLFDYSSIIQSSIRHLLGFTSPSDYWFFNMRSLGGAIFVLALDLYSYLFLLLKTAFSRQTSHFDHAGSLLGADKFKRFFNKITLPLCAPVIAAGCALIAMETMAEFATVQYFAIHTLTTAIYDTSLGLGSLGSAAKLSVLLLLFIFLLPTLEKYFQKKNL